MKKRFPILFCFLLPAALLASAQKGIAVSAAVDKSAIVIGEQAHLVLQASFTGTAAPLFFTVDTIPHFEILNRSKIDTQSTAGGVVLQQTLTITSWDSGTWQLAPFALPDAAGGRTKPVTVKVGFSNFDPDQPYHDVKDILEVKPGTRTTWYWYLIGAVFLLLLFLLMFPGRKKAPAPVAAAPEDAYRLAVQRLERLKGEAPDDKLFFTELVNIFRDYLQRRKGIHSFQQTTDDLSRQVAALQLKGDYGPLVQTLQLSDFVKFAKYAPTASEREAAWETIRHSINVIEQLK